MNMSLERSKLCYELKITERIKETFDAVTLVFDIPDRLKEKFRYKAGQFVTFFLDIDGSELRRSYSLCTSPDYDQRFAVTVKRVAGGKGSTFLTEKTNVGDRLWTTPPAGRFTLPDKMTEQKLAFYAAGSGITPIISLIKSALKTTQLPTHLLYQNSQEDSIIFKGDLDELSRSGRLTVVHILSNPEGAWNGPRGRVDSAKVRDFLIKQQIGIRSLHFLCGPDGFMKTIADTLRGLNVESTKIIQESFATLTSTAESATTTSAASKTAAGVVPDLRGMVLIGDSAAQGDAPEQIEAIIDGVATTVPFKKNTSVLETLLDAGLNPPYSCMDGACMACMAKVESGLVYQKDPGILNDDNIDAGECLTCQARPASKTVRINYNTF
jgi:ferredoxin-NADP reductase/ferredoxin